MNEVHELLEFNFDSDYFHTLAKGAIPESLKSHLSSKINILVKINCEFGAKAFKFPGNKISQIFRKTKLLLQQNFDSLPLDRRELRLLSYSLNYSENNLCSIFSNYKELEKVLYSLNNNWRDSFLLGLFDCYLSNWDSKTDNKVILGKLILNKLKNYSGNRPTLKAMKLNIKFFNYNNGDIVLGTELALNNNMVSQATQLLSIPESFFTYPYFSRVILSFYDKNKNNINSSLLDDIISAIEQHNCSSTNKRIISKLIIQANSSDYAFLQEKVINIAFKFIGDPVISPNWLPSEDMSEMEVSEFQKAKSILNEWITKQFITVFFERCINDIRRKQFWIKYAKYITRFKVFGSVYTKKILKSDTRISEYLNDRFFEIYSSSNKSVFMFLINNYKLIEFSDPGYAFYAYKNNNTEAPSFEPEHIIRSVDVFRDGSKPLLVRRSSYLLYSYNDEGRLSHMDGDLKWEDVFSRWLNVKVGVNV